MYPRPHQGENKQKYRATVESVGTAFDYGLYGSSNEKRPLPTLQAENKKAIENIHDPRMEGYADRDQMTQAMDWDPFRSDLSDPEYLTADRPLSRTNPLTTAPDLIQFFIRTLQGSTVCKRIWKGRRIQELKCEIQNHLGILATFGYNHYQSLKGVQDDAHMWTSPIFSKTKVPVADS